MDRRPPWLVLLLAGSLTLMAVLAWRALAAAESHRQLAEEVLGDYAALAGEELLRRLAVQIGYYGYQPVLTALAEEDAASSGSAAGETPARADLDGDLVDWTFRYSAEGGLVASRAPSETLRAWLVAQLAAGASEPEAVELAGAAGMVDGRPVRAVWRGGGDLVGFVVRLDGLRRQIAEAVDRGPLLPGSLSAGRVGNEALFVRVSGGDGLELYRTQNGAGRPTVERRLPEDYATALRDLVVEVAIALSAADDLLIGGLPDDPLALLTGLMALDAGLIAVALLLVGRERALVRLQADFVSRVSHELRTPLTQIRMFAETLRLGRVRNDEEAGRALEVIDREARRLSGLVENVLQYSRSKRGVVGLEPRSTRVAAAVDRAVDELSLAVRGGTVLRRRITGDPAVVADPDALHQVLLNLLDNALKYGPPGQEVVVGAEARGDVVVIRVEDQGPGIAEVDRERVWEPFHRGTAEPGGSGIGLAVVRDLVDRHGGRCWIEDGSGGARVILELPAGDGR